MAGVVGSVGGCALTNASQTHVSSRVWVRREDGGVIGKNGFVVWERSFPLHCELGRYLGTHWPAVFWHCVKAGCLQKPSGLTVVPLTCYSCGHSGSACNELLRGCGKTFLVVSDLMGRLRPDVVWGCKWPEMQFRKMII